MALSTIGSISLLLLFGLCALTLVLSVLAAQRGSSRLANACVQSLYASTSAAVLSSALIVMGFLSDDFSIRYIQSNSDIAMPLFYKVTAFWGGLDGSLLFWVLLLSVFSAHAVRRNKERHRAFIPYVVGTLATILLFFVALMLFFKNPFAPFTLETPAEGRGLNPLLQNIYMVVHPPSLYLGYVSLAVPYAFGMAALFTGQLDDAWQASVRRWTLFSWTFLSVGLILGGLWAYEELGWGGYWAWDPVENAGLLPWLTTTAFLHSVMIQERRGMMKVWNLVLVIISFWLSIMGTFLTRSGVVQSVHSFGRDPVLAWVFGVLLAVILLVSFGLLIWRLPRLRARNELESLLSREFAFLVNNWVLLLMAFFVLGSVLYPSISELWGERITIRESHYNHYMVPAGLALLLTTGVGPLLAWRKTTRKNLIVQFRAPMVAGVAVVLLCVFLGLDNMWGLTCFGLCAFTATTIMQEFFRGIRAQRAGGQRSVPSALLRLLLRARRRYGGYIVHLGVVLMFFGWAGKSYDSQRDVNLKVGQQIELAGYEITLDSVRATQDWQKEMLTAELRIERGGRFVDRLYPAKWWYFKLPEQPTSEVSRALLVGEDVYSALVSGDADKGVAFVRIFINPLVNWVWAGAGIMLLGCALCIGTRKMDEGDRDAIR